MRNGRITFPITAASAHRRRTPVRALHGAHAGPQCGFTYLGLLIAVTIIGTVLATAGTVWQTAQQREHEQELLFVGDQFRLAIARYYAAGRQYPDNLEDLLRDPRLPGVARYLRKLYRDPVTGTTDWGVVRDANNRIMGVYSQSESPPIKQTGFSTADQEFEGKEKLSQWIFLYKPRPTRTRYRSPPPTSPDAKTGTPASLPP